MEYEKRQIIHKAQIIKDTFLDLSCEPSFIKTIEKGTYDTEQVKERTEKWLSKLREVVGYPTNDRRLYTYQEKLDLYEKADKTCALCRNLIDNLDDAQVDHIEKFSEGGNTTLKNGQITHRYCNLSKG